MSRALAIWRAALAWNAEACYRIAIGGNNTAAAADRSEACFVAALLITPPRSLRLLEYQPLTADGG